MNKQLVVALLLGAASAINLGQKESIPDYWNDYRFHGRKGWVDAENPRYADPDQWVNTTQVLYPGYADVISMTDDEIAYRLTNAGKRGVEGAVLDQHGLSQNPGQLAEMHNYIQINKEDADPLAADAEQARAEEKGEKANKQLEAKSKAWWQRGDPAEKVSFVDPVIARQHTTFYGQQGQHKMAQTAEYNEDAGLWMLVNVEEDGDVARAEKAAADKAKEKDIKEAADQKSGAAAKVGETAEKVSVIEPMAYERRYNYNSIDQKPLMRTTFYGQKGSEELLQQADSGIVYNARAGLWMLA